VFKKKKRLPSTLEDSQDNDNTSTPANVYLTQGNKLNQSSKTLLNTIDNIKRSGEDMSETKSLVNKNINITKVIARKNPQKMKGRPPMSPAAKFVN